MRFVAGLEEAFVDHYSLTAQGSQQVATAAAVEVAFWQPAHPTTGSHRKAFARVEEAVAAGNERRHPMRLARRPLTTTGAVD